MILLSSIYVFVSQLIFIWARTLNVRAVSMENTPAVLITGAVVHLSWLASIAIGAVSMHEIIANFQYQYWPVIASSLAGGTLGSYFGMRKKRKR